MSTDRIDLSDRTVLVTGATDGLGRALARKLASAGATVLLHGRDRERLRQTEAEIQDATGPHRLRCYRADLSSLAEVRTMADAVVAGEQRLDVLVNNAGISWPVPHADLSALSAADWRRLLDVNLIAPWLLCTAAEPALRSSKGCIVNVTSHAGVRPKGSSIGYAAGKAALNHVTRLLAAALGPDIRVNAVAPGLVDTPLTAGWVGAQELWRTESPMRRPAQPDDVADLISALVRNSYLTGEVILLDGGLNLR
jgi:NAD(P)-dependent dehydrogenase (short-subunit alcohol dehydrogenase family)